MRVNCKMFKINVGNIFGTKGMYTTIVSDFFSAERLLNSILCRLIVYTYILYILYARSSKTAVRKNHVVHVIVYKEPLYRLYILYYTHIFLKHTFAYNFWTPCVYIHTNLQQWKITLFDHQPVQRVHIYKII